ncbi:hypothetical protein FHR32_006273 [Streptosporangium album]|uniref:Uncharacterized protein n=1 Tax=Streptosporangium album TaxID=47479 RepID=A0A7W7S1L0_9ACTN|nr:hypothetical protein [Streptosporangium album]MBB4941887.1 hypothetical protein [Streptosporangium album]
MKLAGDMATRYDKRERIYQGTIDVASIRIWLRDGAGPATEPERTISSVHAGQRNDERAIGLIAEGE